MTVVLLLKGNWVYIKGRIKFDIECELDNMMRFQPADYMWTTSYQEGEWDENIVDKALAMKRGIISLPTGTGKTVIACKLIHEIGLSTVIYVTRLELMIQWKRFIENILNYRDIGLIGHGEKDNIKPITVAMVHTAHKLPQELFENFAVSIYEECHHVPADTVYRLSMRTQSPYLYGLSATPRREDGKEPMLKGGIGPIIVNYTVSDMIRQGYLAKPYIDVTRVSSIPFPPRTKFEEVYRKAIVDNDERNDIIVQKVLEYNKTNKSIYVHVRRIRHGKILQRLIPGSVFLHGRDRLDYRKKVIDNFKNNGGVLISTLLGEGVDIPSMDVLVLACGGLSETFVRQTIGRVLRITAKKKKVIIVDIEDRSKFLYKHWLNRQRIYQSEPEFVYGGC